MKKKILMVVLCAAIMLLPSIVAVLSYTNAQKNPVTRTSVSKLEVISPEGSVFSFDKSTTGGESMLNCFFNMNEQAETVPSLLSPVSEYKVFSATYQSYNKSSRYTYFFTQDPANAFYRSDDGKYYRIASETAGQFLATEYAACLFPSAAQPTLYVGDGIKVLPQMQLWKFLGYNGEYFDSVVETEESVVKCDVTGGLQLQFDVVPDHLFVTMKNEKGETVHEDVLDKIDPSLFSDNTVYDVTVIAKWYQTEERSNYGEATYYFQANVLSPAVFYLNTTETEYGNFVVVSAKNIVDPTQIRFQADPPIEFSPVFFEYGDYHHALIPFSMACEEQNDGASEYNLTFSYGDVDQLLRLNVSQRKISKAYQNTSLEKINTYRSSAALTSFAETMRQPFTNLLTDLYWMEDNMLTVPVSGRKIKVGYGLEIVLSHAKISYRHEGVNYTVQANDPVLSCLPGKVVYVGETTLSGNTVVIDHGGGLKSLYAHLSSTAATVGDVVEKGQIIGIVGKTGFCDGRTLHFGLYVFDVPVRYYEYETNGIRVAEAVAKNMGLSSSDNFVPTE